VNAILNIAKTTIGEAVRRRVLLVILLIGVLFLVIAPGINILTPRQEYSVLVSLTLGIIQLTSAVIAIVLTVYLIPNEIERRTIYTILSKPVQRWQFLVGKYLGAIGALGLMMLMMTVILVVVFGLLQRGTPVETLLEIARTPALFYVQMCLLAAVALFFSTFVSPIVNFFLSGGTYLVGSLFNSLFDSIAQDESLSPVVKGASTIIHTIVPNFQNFNVQNTVINPTQQIRGEALYFVELAFYAIAYIAILLIGGVLIFDRREV
jgi:ABC-type transport system involved in multi-copper enzyme maturation permease subunit